MQRADTGKASGKGQQKEWLTKACPASSSTAAAFPLLLLNMPAAFDELTTLVEALAQELLAAPANEAVGLWDNMKEQLRRASVDIYRRHQNMRVQVARQADANAAAAWGRVCHAHIFFFFC